MLSDLVCGGIWFLLYFVIVTRAIGGEDMELTVLPSEMVYIPSDTVIVALKMTIPPGHVLYGNPVGPGAGRPLSISVKCDDPGVRWLSVKKLKAEKFGPPFGDWVWIYRNEAVFFCIGIVAAEYDWDLQNCSGTIIFEGLLCRNACTLIEKSVPFSFTIGMKKRSSEQFENNGDILKKYRCAVPMMDLRYNLKERGRVREPVHEPPLRWKSIVE